MKNIETKITKKIEYQESDYLGEYKLANLLSLFADIATENAYQIGFWSKEIKDKYGWVLSKETIKLTRPIKCDEEITVSTRSKGGSRVQFFRTFEIKSHEEVIGGAYSIWTMIDLEKRQIIRPQSIGIKLPELEEFPCLVDKYQPVSKQIMTKLISQRTVLYSDVDTNKHFNNAKYLEWALDLMPFVLHQDNYIEQLSMHFRKEIAPLSLVDLYYGQENNNFKVEFKVDDTLCFELSGTFKAR